MFFNTTKKNNVGLGIITMMTLSHVAFADTCYDPDRNSTYHPYWILWREYTEYKNLQEWELWWEIQDSSGKPTNELKHDNHNEIAADSLRFTQATYSPTAGLDCKYLLRWNDVLFIPGVSSGYVHLVKQRQYTEGDFADHPGWQKDATMGTYKCTNDHVEACAFK